MQQLSEDFATKFRIERTAASSLEWQPKYSITELNASKHTAYFPTDRVSLEKVLPKKLFIDCMGKFEPIQQEGVSQTSKVAVSGRKPKKEIQVFFDEEDLDEVAEEQVEEGKRKIQQKYPSTITRPKTKTFEGDKASATAEEANKKESSIESGGFDIQSVEEEEEEEEDEEGEEEEEEGVEEAEKGVEGKEKEEEEGRKGKKGTISSSTTRTK